MDARPPCVAAQESTCWDPFAPPKASPLPRDPLIADSDAERILIRKVFQRLLVDNILPNVTQPRISQGTLLDLVSEHALPLPLFAPPRSRTTRSSSERAFRSRPHVQVEHRCTLCYVCSNPRAYRFAPSWPFRPISSPPSVMLVPPSILARCGDSSRIRRAGHSPFFRHGPLVQAPPHSAVRPPPPCPLRPRMSSAPP